MRPIPDARSRERFTVAEPGEPAIVIQRHPAVGDPRGDVVYVHGATFGADLSIFFPFDGQSWGDSLASAGFTVWGFDFVGYGLSDRSAADPDRPAGGMDAAVVELRRAIAAIRERNDDRPVFLLAHSRGAAVAARYAGEHPLDVRALALFAPIVPRAKSAMSRALSTTAPPSHYRLSAWAQYRRFIDDVPRGQPQVLSEAHMHAWGTAFLATDANAEGRAPPSVMIPSGPLADIAEMWSGHWLYDPSAITVPTLIVRGEWDSLCDDSDAAKLIKALGTSEKRDVRIPRATHLMHLEEQRVELYAEVSRFLDMHG